MKILSKLLIASATGLVLKGISNVRKEHDEEKRRESIACKFTDELTEENFEDIAKRSVKKLRKKKITIEVYGAKVYGTVESQSGLTEWDFTIDFNDYGSVIGMYWIWSENDDSLIPQHIADTMQEEIQNTIN